MHEARRVELTTNFEEEQTESVLSAITEPLVVAGLCPDSLGEIKLVSRSFLRLLGYSWEDVAGIQLDRLFEDPELARATAARLSTEAQIRELTAALITADGSPVPVSISASALTDGPGGQSDVVALVRDMRDHVSLVEELKATRDELARRVSYLEDFRKGVIQMLRDLDRSERELDETCTKLKITQDQLVQSSKLTALGELAAGLAHELNQPLTVIKGLSQSMLGKLDGWESEGRKLQLIVESASKMEMIIRHLRIFSRVEEQAMDPLDINEVIKETLIILKDVLFKYSVDIRCELGDVPVVLGSANRFEQVIINLATNARDSMPEGGELLISTSRLEAGSERFARMSITDTGCGIPAEALPRIFDPFFTTKAPGTGTGLGLSISYGIIKEHNGELTVESTPGKGTTFHVTLPAVD